jgi:hypothetical protein
VAQPEPTLSSLAAKVAAHASWKNTENRTARTAKARAAALAKFEREVDPDGKLSVAERRTRAEHALGPAVPERIPSQRMLLLRRTSNPAARA